MCRKSSKRPRPARSFLFLRTAPQKESLVSLATTAFHLEDTMPDRTMFERSMFSDTLDSSWAERSRRGWTTLTSFGLQALVTSVLLLLPLLRPMGLPSFHQLSTPISLGQPLAEAPAISLGQPLAEAPAIEAHAGSNRAPARPTQIVFRPPWQPRVGMPTRDEGPPQIANGP